MRLESFIVWAGVVTGVGIRCFVRFNLGFAKGPLGLAFDLWGLCPYLALALVSKHIRQKLVLLVAAAALVGTDLSASLEAIYGSASTSAIALGVQPLFAILVLIPSTLLVSKALDLYLGAPPMTRSAAGEPNDDEKKNEDGESDGDEEK